MIKIMFFFFSKKQKRLSAGTSGKETGHVCKMFFSLLIILFFFKLLISNVFFSFDYFFAHFCLNKCSKSSSNNLKKIITSRGMSSRFWSSWLGTTRAFTICICRLSEMSTYFFHCFSKLFECF